ncbi:MAG: D-alanine--D-alanine ligase [Patescibacteria group bacterium]
MTDSSYSLDDEPSGTKKIKSKITVAFLYNTTHIIPTVNDPRSQLQADYDEPQAIDLMVGHLKNNGYDVIPIEANEKAYLELYKRKKDIDIVFNIAEGPHGHDRELQVPAMLEMLQIPYTGCTPLTQGILLNKARTKEILAAYKIRTLPFMLIKNGTIDWNMPKEYPLFVKPNSQGCSGGITQNSIVHNETELKAQIKYLRTELGQDSIVEPLLTGREFTVPMLGNPPRVLPIIETNFSRLPKGYAAIDSLEVKWELDVAPGKGLMDCPADISKKLHSEIEDLCLRTWSALRVLDWCRIDVRCDSKGTPYVLEVNSPPGITPPENAVSNFPFSAKTAGLDYEAMQKAIIETALKRYGKI